jgi:hypothetical protein
MVRPRSPDALVPLEVGFTPKAIKYLDALREKDGFGSSRPDIIRSFVWKEINRLIEMGRLKEIE